MLVRARAVAIVASAVSMLAAVLTAQGPASPVAFEVVSVKPHTGDDRYNSSGFRPGGLFTVVNGTVVDQIMLAFGNDRPLRQSQVIGAPDWATAARFDISARAPDPNATRRDMLPMLQTLLADRFKAQVHRETREQPVFLLVRARDDGRLGAQLRPSPLDCDAVARARRDGTPLPSNAPKDRPACGFRMDGRADGLTMAAGGIEMARLVLILADYAQRVVVDRTGLTGVFDVDLHWDLDRTNPLNDAPAVFTAVQEQLGLKLESSRAPVDVLVIDHVERPTED